MNLITGSAQFAIGMSTIDLSTGDGTPDLNNASLVTVALSALNLQVGVGGYGMTLTGGTLGLAAITPSPIPAVNGSPSTATDNRLWLAVNGTITNGHAQPRAQHHGASASNVTVQINQASGAYTLNGSSTLAMPLDWTKDISLDGGDVRRQQQRGGFGQDLPTPVAMPITYNTSLIQIQASIALSIESYVYISGSVSFTKTGPLEVTPAGGGAAISVNALEIGASNVDAFVGTGGQYWAADPNKGPFTPTNLLLPVPWAWPCRTSAWGWCSSRPPRPAAPATTP